MPPEDQFDLRDMRDGNFSWFQNELHYLFRPLIGTDAAWLYTVMAWLVPQAEALRKKGVAMKMSITKLQDSSGLARGTTHRSLQTLLKVGMLRRVDEVYELADLRELAEVGIEELRRRLSVPPGNDGEGGEGSDDRGEGGQNGPQSRTSEGDGDEGGFDLQASAVEAPIAEEEDIVPGGNDDARATGSDEKGRNSGSLRGDRSPGDTIRSRGEQNRSPGDTNRSTGNLPLILKEESQGQRKNPPTPASGGAADLPFADRRHGDQSFAGEAGIAARWVMGACELGLNSRLKQVIEAALTRRAKRTGTEGLHRVAQLAVENFHGYHHAMEDGLLRFGPWKPRTFFENPYWENDGTWPWDQAKLAERKRAVVGARPAAAAAPAELDVAGFIARNAAAIDAEDLDLDKAFSEELRALAGMAKRNEPIERLDERLQVIEDRIAAELVLRATEEALDAFRREAAKEYAAQLARMTKAQRDDLLRRYVEKRLLETNRVPRLSLFYMDRRASA